MSDIWVPLILFCLVAVLTAIDIHADLMAGTTVLHVVIESMLVLAASIGAVYFWRRLQIVRQARRELEQDLNEARAENARWHEEERELLYNLKEAIERQFTKWDFSAREKEIAYCLLKGLSMKQIAELKGGTHRAVRQQAYVLYHKAGLTGRNDLSAFFLGGLLHPHGSPAAVAADKEYREKIEVSETGARVSL